MAEATTQPETLAKTLLYLGIDGTFLKSGELQKLPRDARGRVVDEMIDQKLTAGRWQGVVEMIFGGIGKADVLYGGDLEELRGRIIDSVKILPSQDIGADVLEILKEKQERELLYGIAMASERFSFNNIEGIVSPLFEDPEKGAEREKEFHTRAARLYFEGGNYRSALEHFVAIQDSDGVTDVFEKGLAKIIEERYVEDETRRFVLDAAVYNPEHKNERLRRFILTTLEGGISIREAFNLFKGHDVQLTEEERTALYDSAAANFSSHDLTEWADDYTGRGRDRKQVEIDPVLSLLWARKHAEERPEESYTIFTNQGYEGPEVLRAARRGLEIELEHPHEKYASSLSAHNISQEHLRAVYSEVPLRLRKDIAILLREHEDFNYRESLQQISREAEEEGNLELAYDCWSLGGGDEETLTKIRSNLIQRDLDKANESKFGSPRLHFLNRLDRVGYKLAIDSLVETAPASKRPFEFMERAHELAMLGTGEQIDNIRRGLVEMDTIRALKVFMGSSYLYRREGEEREMDDPEGFNYALGVMAQQQEISVDDLRPLVEKYAYHLR